MKKAIQVLPALTIFMIAIAISLSKTGISSMEQQREDFINHKNSMIKEMIMKGDYSCCLENPCTYCIEKSSKHGDGATCKCLDDIMNGRHPCGECMGEIMEGHGNRFIAKYFAAAIADEMGDQHLPALKQMMAEKYGVPVDEQKG